MARFILVEGGRYYRRGEKGSGVLLGGGVSTVEAHVMIWLQRSIISSSLDIEAKSYREV